MKSFTAPFNTARNKTAHAPVSLLRIDWPAINGNPAKTVRLCDRGAYSAAGQSWLPLVGDWGELSRNIDETLLSANSDADLRLAIVNAPADFGGAMPQTFSELFLTYPPEAAITAKVYQWFDGEGLAPGDLVELFTAHVTLIGYDEESVEIELVAISGVLGERVIGTPISLADYPNAPPASVGLIKPVVIGRVDGAPGIRVRDVAETELTASVVPGDSVIAVKDTGLFPANGQFSIDGETMTYTAKTATTFTGCRSLVDTIYNGVALPHYNGDKAVQDIGDHRYLFSDPAYPVKSITNVKVAGQPADAGEYAVDLALGEARFFSRPKTLSSVNSTFLEAQFDAVAPSNTALDPGNAYSPNAVTSHATINQNNPSLRLLQTNKMADRGAIRKVRVGVEHYEEEKLPHDSITVGIASLGIIGTLAKPNADDRITVAADVDVIHSHLNTIGGNVDIGHATGHNIGGNTDIGHGHTENIDATLTDPSHYHDVNTDGERTETQNTVTALGTVNAAVGQVYSFPASSGATLKAEYMIALALNYWSVGAGGGYVYLNGVEVARLFFPQGAGFPPSIVYTPVITLDGAQLNNATLSAGGFSYVSVTVTSLSRRLVFKGNATSVAKTTGAGVTKSGTVNNLGATGKSATMTGGVDTIPATQRDLAKTGDITPVNLVPPIGHITQEKTSRAVIEYFDIPVTDWNWFEGQEVRVTYAGSSDGRSAYILHVFFDIEYAVPSYTFTDQITADVEGVKDTAGGITGAVDALIERPDHVFKWSLLTIIGLTAGDLDLDSFTSAGSSFASAISGGYKIAGIINGTKTFKELWTAWERETRSYLYFTNTGKAKLLYRMLNDLTGVSSSKSITTNMIRADNGKSRIKAKRTQTLANTIDLKYNRDWGGSPVIASGAKQSSSGDGNYASILSVRDPASQAIYGIRRKPELFNFDWTRSSAQAADIANFHLLEYSIPMTIIEAEVFLDNLELERGDVIDITHTFDNMTARKALVLEVNHHLGSGKANKMDSITLLARLFTVNHILSTTAESVTVTDDLVPYTLNMTLAEAIAVADTLICLVAATLAESLAVNDGLTTAIDLVLAESIMAEDSFQADYSMLSAEQVDVADSLLRFADSGGFGVQPFGSSPFGDMIPLSELSAQAGETLAVSDGLVVTAGVTLADGITLTDALVVRFDEAVNITDVAWYPNEGFGLQWFGTGGFGGMTKVS